MEQRRLWHDPRKRQCTLASLTSFTFEDDRIVSVGYTEPARDLVPAHLLAGAKPVKGGSKASAPDDRLPPVPEGTGHADRCPPARSVTAAAAWPDPVPRPVNSCTPRRNPPCAHGI